MARLRSEFAASIMFGEFAGSLRFLAAGFAVLGISILVSAIAWSSPVVLHYAIAIALLVLSAGLAILAGHVGRIHAEALQQRPQR